MQKYFNIQHIAFKIAGTALSYQMLSLTAILKFVSHFYFIFIFKIQIVLSYIQQLSCIKLELLVLLTIYE